MTSVVGKLAFCGLRVIICLIPFHMLQEDANKLYCCCCCCCCCCNLQNLSIYKICSCRLPAGKMLQLPTQFLAMQSSGKLGRGGGVIQVTKG